ncbi:peroxisomal coenzyme A diphosphatase NUDT7-like [Haemorhous mexicanus]|uniref:peroxisomal coenzyme A diphosphatase NUDT7-like n=1 Tax=Haemorhous mexicanus TaxID=30427 RepID=UPI0028BDA955|nr:peroxisomal coenzyme A diphosphatase NUDT7-like [Haemorhous mexicanus]
MTEAALSRSSSRCEPLHAGVQAGRDGIDGAAAWLGQRGPAAPGAGTGPEGEGKRKRERERSSAAWRSRVPAGPGAVPGGGAGGAGPCPCPGAAGDERGAAGGCRCSALPAPGLMEQARHRLRDFDVGDRFSRLPLPRAAVLLPLMVRGGRLQLLLTVRSLQLRRSPGEVCFPGGKREATDKDDIDTALREAKEEVGLQPEKVEVICRLMPGIDKMNNLVTPVVGFIEDTFQATPNPDEVSEVFLVPLEYFVKPLNYKTFSYKTSSGYSTRVHCFIYHDQEHKKSFKIWGLTAHFAVFLALVIFGERPTFEVDYDLDNLISSSENYFINLYASVHEGKKSNL